MVLGFVLSYQPFCTCIGLFSRSISLHIGKNILLLFVDTIHKVIPTHFFATTTFVILYLLNNWIDLLINYITQIRHSQVHNSLASLVVIACVI